MSDGHPVTSTQIEQVFRRHYGKAVATLVRAFDDIDLAEEGVQEAFAAATARWPAEGLPPSPEGWIIMTARNRTIDRLRREGARHERQRQAYLLHAADDPIDPGVVGDDQLRLLFACCHPALATGAQVALTLRLLGGLSTAAIARAFLVPEPTMAQRLVRAKGKIRDAAIPIRMPAAADLPGRLRAVSAVVYLVFNEGHTASSGDRATREDLCAEAIRLGRLLVELVPDDPEPWGLLALMLLVESRRAARTAGDGEPVLLAEQDRRRWDGDLMAEGRAIVRECLRGNRPGPYQVQAAINAVHSDAAEFADTDWEQIVALYDQLLALAPSPVVALNRSVAVAELAGPGPALQLVDQLEGELVHYHLHHAVRADLLLRLGRRSEAAQALRAAMSLTDNPGERSLLAGRLRKLDGTADGAGPRAEAR
jgi:RNA polymerase sigma-70 factor, ECF subfamily